MIKLTTDGNTNWEELLLREDDKELIFTLYHFDTSLVTHRKLQESYRELALCYNWKGMYKEYCKFVRRCGCKKHHRF